MYFFFHLFTGIVLGLVIGDLLHDRRWVIPCAFGAVLPDLIDKPVGQIIFATSIGYGRIYGHTLLFFLLVLVAGLVVWNHRKTPAVCGIAVGILSHQLLDQMWREQANWLYPLLGPFQGHLSPDYINVLILDELHNPSEAVLAILIGLCALLYVKYRQEILGNTKSRAILKGSLLFGALILFILGGIVLGRGMVGQTLPYTSWSEPVEYLMGGIVLELAACAAWRLHGQIGDGPLP
jgi:membrane-bound metal-dependent hydrolase YbcI (DUF457 family)